MSLKHVWGVNVRTDAGSAASQTDSIEYGGEVNFNDVAESSGVLEVDETIVVADIKSFFIYSDKDVTLHTNTNSVSSSQTISLLAGKMLWWNENANGSNPLTSNITKLYFNNASTSSDAKVKGSFLIDVTS